MDGGFWGDKFVIVTGGGGFLGYHVVRALADRGLHSDHVLVPRRNNYDLRNAVYIERMFIKAARVANGLNKIIVIHLAANVGGIGYNQRRPGELFYDNAMMGIQLIEAARIWGIHKIVTAGTVCAYPAETPIPFREENLWNGYPEITNAPYGLAKKMLLVQSGAYRQQYGLNAVYLLPVNLYGPRDDFDLENSHVIPALIRKFIEAVEENKSTVTLWGDGSPTREFLYVTDAAEAILLAAEHYNESNPVNVGSGQEVSIKRLADTIALMTDFKGKIVWDTSRPNGQPRRALNVSRAKMLFGFEAKVSLDQGLGETIYWYKHNRSGKI